MNIFDLFKKDRKPAAETNQPLQSETPEVKPSDTKSEDVSTSSSDAKSIIPEGTKRVHNLIILDESGSMHSIYNAALSGVNETLQTIREAQNEHKTQEHYVSLIAFDSGHYNQIYANTPAQKAVDITEAQYHPGGNTPLFDAMGRAINELHAEVAEGDYVLVTIITDGYENASREFNGKTIKSLVETMKKEGWVFTYIGANQDVEAVAMSMSIDNHLAFHPDASSTKAMFSRERRSRKNFFSKLDMNMSRADLSRDYFADKDNKPIDPDEI